MTAHAHPVWKVVLSPSGVLVGGHNIGVGALLPPEQRHDCAALGPYVAMFLPPSVLDRPDRMPVGPVPIGASTTDALLALARAEMLDVEEVTGRLGARGGVVRDERAAIAEHLSAFADVTVIAAQLGISTARLRVLARRELGVSINRLRGWGRLRRAVSLICRGHQRISDIAAETGFADHPHLGRSCRQQLGRTPSSLVAR